MIQYQQIVISTGALVGQPGPLPSMLRGLSDASLGNLSAALTPGAVTQLALADVGYVPVVTPDVPQIVNRLQFVTALQNGGKLAAVTTAINALPATDPVRIYFTNTAMFTRTDPRLLAFATAMGQTAAQVDAVFIAAAAVPQ